MLILFSLKRLHLLLFTGFNRQNFINQSNANAFVCMCLGMLVATATILYGWYAGYDTRWIPYPDANRLSWSYGISVCGGLLAIIASFIEFVDFLRLHIVKVQEKREETYAPSVLSNVRY